MFRQILEGSCDICRLRSQLNPPQPLGNFLSLKIAKLYSAKYQDVLVNREIKFRENVKMFQP